MARPYGSDPGRWSEDRRRWTEGEDIRSAPEERERRPADSTRDMDFGGGYGGGEERRGRWFPDEPRDRDERWGGSSSWERDRGGSRGGGWRDEDRDREWRDRGGGMMGGGRERDRDRGDERWRAHDEGPGGGYRGGYGGTGGYGSSTGGYGASGLTGSAGRWGPGGAGYSGGGYSGGGSGFGGGGSYGGGRYGRGGEESYGSGSSYGGQYGAQQWRSEPSWGERDYRGEGRWGERDEGWRGGGRDDRSFMERMGDKFRHGMDRITGRGPKGYRRSDERIREDVCERIARSGVNAEDVEVQVETGEVTLSGEVENRWDKRHLEDMIDDIFGVDEVHNHLRLRRETATSTESREGEAGTSGLPH